MEKLAAFRTPATPGTTDSFVHFFSIKQQKRESELAAMIAKDEELIQQQTDPEKASIMRVLHRLVTSYNANVSVPFKNKFNFTNALNPDDRDRIFIPAINALYNLADAYNVPLPSKDLQDRIMLVDGETFENITDIASGDQTGGFVAVTSPNRLCLLNNGLITQECGENGIRRDNFVRAVGIHEALHSLEEKETWVEDEQDEFKEFRSLRRAGITVRSERLSQAAYYGLCRLEEGIVDYFTRKILRLAGLPLGKAFLSSYGSETLVIDTIVRDLGSDNSLFQALFTKKGYLTFARALESKYGEHALRNIAEAMGRDYQIRWLATLEEGRNPPYRKTLHFIREYASRFTVDGEGFEPPTSAM